MHGMMAAGSHLSMVLSLLVMGLAVGLAVAAPAGQRRLGAFEKGTDPRFRKVNSATFTAGGADVRIDLPRTGLLSSVILQLTGTMTLGAPTSFATFGPWNIFKRIQVYTNTGTVSLWDTTGWGAYLMGFLQDEGYAPDKSTLTDVYAAGLAGGANTWNLFLELPIAMNAGVDRRWGLINLQSPEVIASVQVTPGANTDAVTSIGGAAGFGSATLTVYYRYYEVPNPAKYELPPLAVHRVIESSQSIATTGDQVFTVPRQGTLLRLAHYFLINGSRDSADLSTFSIRYNITGLPIVKDRVVMEKEARDMYGQDLPTGTFVHDRWHAAELVGAGPLWDAIDTEAVAQLDSVPNVQSSASVIAGDKMGCIREFVQGLKRAS